MTASDILIVGGEHEDILEAKTLFLGRRGQPAKALLIYVTLCVHLLAVSGPAMTSSAGTVSRQNDSVICRRKEQIGIRTTVR